MSQVIYLNEDFAERVSNRIRTLTLAEAKKEVSIKSSEGGAVLLDIYHKEVLYYEGFEHLLSKGRIVTLAVLHGLVFHLFYEILFRRYCRSVREVLQMNGLNRLKGTHFEMTFPSKIKTPNPFGGMSHRLMELQSEPILLVYPNGDITFASLDLYVLKGAFRPQEFFPVMPIIKQGKKELGEESILVKKVAAPFISKHLLSIWTPRQIDVLEHLARAKKSREIVEILNQTAKEEKDKVTESTIDTHRRDIKARIKPFFAGHNDVDMALILKELGCF